MTLISIRARRWALGVIGGGLALVLGAAFAVAADRDALWHVVRACVAAKQLTGLPFPCLEVNLSKGEAAGYAVLRPPWSNDMILTPTRRSVGVEDPFLQSPDAPNYFADAWRARGMIVTANGRRPARDQVALIVNSAIVRDQDQLHVHVGCLKPGARRFLDEKRAGFPFDEWRLIGAVIPHQPFWAMRVRSADLDGVDPFRLVHAQLGRLVKDFADVAIAVAGTDSDEFLILASYAHAPGSWWPVGSSDMIDKRCLGDGEGEG